MKVIIKLILLLAIFQACSTEIENPCSLSEDVWIELNKMDSLINDSLIKHRQKEWMRCNYDEPSLFHADYETYRFEMHCSGSENYSKIVRITKQDSSYYNVVLKEFKGTTGSPDTKGTLYVFELPSEDWDSLMKEIKNIEFWTSISTCDKRFLHGCTWSIEGYNPEKNVCTMKNYHIIGGCYPVDSSFTKMYDFFENIKLK